MSSLLDYSINFTPKDFPEGTSVSAISFSFQGAATNSVPITQVTSYNPGPVTQSDGTTLVQQVATLQVNLPADTYTVSLQLYDNSTPPKPLGAEITAASPITIAAPAPTTVSIQVPVNFVIAVAPPVPVSGATATATPAKPV